jgi:hypothetical protein
MILLGANNYTLHEDKICLILDQRSESPLTDAEKTVSICIDCEKEGFVKHPFENLYCKSVYLSELSNAFFSQTYAIYGDIRVKVYGNTKNPDLVFITTIDRVKAEPQSFVDMGTYYGKDVGIAELDKLWEEYSPSSLNLPMPEGLPKERVIEIPKRDL